MKRLLREPMVHFLLAGLVLSGLLSWWGIGFDRGDAVSADSRRVVVERQALLDFVQARTRVGDPAESARLFDSLDPEAKRDWIDRYVREEILVREARALGLDRQDEIIRRRLAQKIEFLTVGILEDELEIGNAELETFYHAHGADYRIPTTLTFTHVFFRDSGQGREGRDDRAGHDEGDVDGRPARRPRSDAFLRAEALREVLDESHAGFEAAVGKGEHFLYNRNYVDRTIDEIRSHFGEHFAKTLEASTPDESTWIGPYRSIHGWHVVLLTRRTESRIPALSEILPVVRQDARRQKREAALDQAIAALISKYEIETDPDLAPPP